MKNQLNISIVGRGNVGVHLQKALIFDIPNVSLVDSRSLEGLASESDVVLIAVSDSAIEEVASRIASLLPDFKGIVAHTAGSVTMKVLAPYFHHYGVFYPLQTFNKDLDFDSYQEIPVFIESSDKHTGETLRAIAERFADKVFSLDSESRLKMHIASVFACNFTNAMYAAAETLLKDSGMPFSLLLPLIKRSSEKIGYSIPSRCQTGPAARDDKNIIEKHLSALKDKMELSAIYSLLSDYIIRNLRAR